MLTSLEIENFKGIGARQRIEFAPLTLLFGANVEQLLGSPAPEHLEDSPSWNAARIASVANFALERIEDNVVCAGAKQFIERQMALMKRLRESKRRAMKRGRAQMGEEKTLAQDQER